MESRMSNVIGHDAVCQARFKKHIYFEWNNFCCNIVMATNISINKTLSIHDWVKNYSCENVFNEKIINTFDVLACMQMRPDENKFW